jgi:hypothetical protein
MTMAQPGADTPSASMRLEASFSGPELTALVERLVADQRLGFGTPPLELRVDNQDKPPSMDWVAQWVPSCRRSVTAAWDADYARYVSYTKGTIAKIGVPGAPKSLPATLQLLEALPFELCTFASIHGWTVDGRRYTGESFSELHFPHGWGCAFKGKGHDRLVSRRWLDFGPWRLHRGAQDTSLVQFHDLAADAQTAFAQARPGHRRMGISDEGGFIQARYTYAFDIDGVYEPAERRLRVLVHGREVSQREMLDACAVRHYQALGPQRPLTSVAYLFADEAQARRHLHELWLRALECAAVIDGRELRLDAQYSPVPQKPAWVLGSA